MTDRSRLHDLVDTLQEAALPLAQGGLGGNLPWKTEAPNGDLVKRLWLSNAAPNPSISGALPNAYMKTEYRFIKSSGVLKAAGVKDYTYDKNGNLLSMDEYDCLLAAATATAASARPGLIGASAPVAALEVLAPGAVPGAAKFASAPTP
jgi:hypothetical protein